MNMRPLGEECCGAHYSDSWTSKRRIKNKLQQAIW